MGELWLEIHIKEQNICFQHAAASSERQNVTPSQIRPLVGNGQKNPIRRRLDESGQGITEQRLSSGPFICIDLLHLQCLSLAGCYRESTNSSRHP